MDQPKQGKILQRIQKLRQELAAVTDQQGILASKINQKRVSRNNIYQKIKELHTKIRELKTERDELNSEVKKFKLSRENTKKTLNQTIQKITKLRDQRNQLAKKKSVTPLPILQKNFEAIEWKIQTSTLPLSEEKKLVDHAQTIKYQIIFHEKIINLQVQLDKLALHIKMLQATHDHFHECLMKTVQKSQTLHTEIGLKYSATKKLQTEVEKSQKFLLKNQGSYLLLDKQRNELTNTLLKLESTIHQKKVEQDKRAEALIRSKLKHDAKKKLKGGKQLSWLEFQSLEDEKLIDQD